MNVPPPRFVVLGGPVPDLLRADLLGDVELFEGGELVDPTTDGVLVHAHADIFPALRRFRDGGGRLPIYGLAEGRVATADRIRWIREGADDLLDVATAAAALRRKIRSDSWRPSSADPNLVPLSTSGRVDRWLVAMDRYLPVRDSIVAVLGHDGRARYLDAAFLRDQLVRASDLDGSPEVFGQRRGADRLPLDWSVQVLSPVEQRAQLLNIGAEGVSIALPAPPSQGDLLRVAVEGAAVAGVIDLEVRWQRRASRDRWHAGALAVACTITRTP